MPRRQAKTFGFILTRSERQQKRVRDYDCTVLAHHFLFEFDVPVAGYTARWRRVSFELRHEPDAYRATCAM